MHKSAEWPCLKLHIQMLLTIPECNHFKSQEVGRKRVCPGLIISVSLYPVLNRTGGTERKKIEHRVSAVIFLKFALELNIFTPNNHIFH